MNDLTLEQVKKAGRFATCEVETGGAHLKFTALEGRYLNFAWRAFPPGFTGEVSVPLPEDGWHHIEGCDCEFCRQ